MANTRPGKCEVCEKLGRDQGAFEDWHQNACNFVFSIAIRKNNDEIQRERLLVKIITKGVKVGDTLLEAY